MLNAEVELQALISQSMGTRQPAIEVDIFGTADPGKIAHSIVEYVTAKVGPVEIAFFYQVSVGVVAGLSLIDRTEVVIKIHRWNASVERLSAVQAVQAHLVSCGLPAPRPLMAPEPIGHGIATLEEMVVGDPGDGHDPTIRRALATTLHEFIKAGASLTGSIGLGPPMMMQLKDSQLWFMPHDPRFDFGRTQRGAEWIDELAAQALERLDNAVGLPVIGHFDWRVGNLAFDRDRIMAIYDWDSVAEAREPVVVGNAAGAFSADWSRKDVEPLPSVAEMRSFVEEYEGARGRPFNPDERVILDAANLYLCAYGARCQHSDLMLQPGIGLAEDAGWLRLLRERGGRCLC